MFLVEMKWVKDPIGTSQITQHIGRLILRGGNVRGLYISYSGYAKTGVTTAQEFLATGATLVLSSLQEIISILNKEEDLSIWLDKKVQSALLERSAFVEYL